NSRPNGGKGNGTEGHYRELLQQLLAGLQREELTAILSHEVTAIEQQAFALEITEYLADTVIVLRREPLRRGSRRSLEITKSRGQGYDTRPHTPPITARTGLEGVPPGQRPPPNPSEAQPPAPTP